MESEVPLKVAGKSPSENDEFQEFLNQNFSF